MTTFEIQAALVAVGFSVGPAGVDGIFGRATIAALKAFQKAQGLPTSGIADVATLRRLFPSVVSSPPSIPPWHAEILRLRGTAEIAGKRNSSTIMGWAERLGIWYPNDETAWCGLLMGHVIGLTLPREVLPANVLGARAWEKFGVACKPQVGAIMTFWRGSRSSGFGHVGTYVSESADAYRVASGNHRNQVTDDAWLSKSRFLAARWPATYPLPKSGGKVVAGQSGPLSTNEA